MKYEDKKAFLQAVEASWLSFCKAFEALDESQLRARSVSYLKRESNPAQLNWSPKDVLAHVHGWHRLLLGWHKTGMQGKPQIPAAGFNWRQTPELNARMFREFEGLSSASVVRRLKLSHGRVLKLVQPLSNKQLMQTGHFHWTGKLGFISYVSANTDSHYRWGEKKIRRLIKSAEQNS